MKRTALLANTARGGSGYRSSS